MKLIKPKKIAYLQRTYGVGEKYKYVLSPILFFDLISGEVLTENTQWKKVTEALGDEALDHALPKTTGEFLLAGHAYAPTEDTSTMDVKLHVGDICKTLKITGERQWQHKLLSGWYSTCPQPFEKIPLNYQNAFGSQTNLTNPLGTGGVPSSKLPAIELANERVNSPKSKTLPAGTMPLSIMWPQRAQYQGNYQNNWFEKYFPAMPEDTDMRLFNAAPSDQQSSDFFIGNEHYYFQGVSENNKPICGELPNIKARAFITKHNQFMEVPLKLDTLWFLPDALLGVLIFRGETAVNNSEAEEIAHVVLGYENMSDEPKPLSHYEEVLQLRTDLETAQNHILNEGQLSPSKSAEELANREQKLQEQQQRKIAERKALQEKQLEEMIQVHDIAPPELPTPELTPFDYLLDEEIKEGDVDLSTLFEKMEEQIQDVAASDEQPDVNFPFDIPQLIEEPSPSTKVIDKDEALNNFDYLADLTEHDVLSEDMTLVQIKQQAVQQIKAEQMLIAPEALLIDSDAASKAMRDVVINALASQTFINALKEKNITGADLSGLTFKNVDFSATVLSFCDLRNATFSDCQFEESSLCNAILDNCEFINCQMSGANLSGVNARCVTFSSCLLSHTQWNNSKITHANFKQCDFSNALLVENQLTKCTLSECVLMQVTWFSSRVNDSDFNNCRIEQSTFNDSHCDMTRWFDCQFIRSVFQQSTIRLATFENTTAEKVVFSIDSLMTGSNFIHSQWLLCNFRSAFLSHSRMSNSVFNQCDFSEANMHLSAIQNTKLLKCIAAKTDFNCSYFKDVNCYQSRFRAAKFTHNTLKNINFLDADLMWAQFQNTSTNRCLNLSKVAKRDARKRAEMECDNDHKQRA